MIKDIMEIIKNLIFRPGEILAAFILNFKKLDFIKAIKLSLNTLIYRVRINQNHSIENILNYAGKRNIKFTFFITGNYAKKNQTLIKEIYSQGHEIGSHSMHHSRLSNSSINHFRTELLKSIEIFNNLDLDIYGYRAPFLLFNKKFYKILKESNLLYSSSIMSNRPFYQLPEGLFEVPVNFMDYFLLADKLNEKEKLSIMKKNSAEKTIHLYHPYGFADIKNSNSFIRFLDESSIPFIRIIDLLKGKKGQVISIDIGW